MTDNKCDAIASNCKMHNDDCTVNLEQSEKLLQSGKMQNLQMFIEFDNLCYTVQQKGIKKAILSNVTGNFDSGKLTMIVGPSGAGKTTLLKIITGERLLNVKGTITVNGIDINRKLLRKQICYVPQHFVLESLLTTKETLYIATRLKLDTKKSDEDIHLIIDEIAQNLGMTDCLNTMVQYLSGGEQKRLSIGVEMITKPPILLLDEPTSGLDSIASNQLINVLQNMAIRKCTVVCTIHQPSSQMISQFDEVIVLNQGKCMYCGPRNKILEVFNIAGFVCPNFYNIMEFVLEVITKQRDGDLDNLYKICQNEYKKRLCNKQLEKDTCSTVNSKKTLKTEVLAFESKTNSIWEQQKILFLKNIICTKRDWMMTKVKYLTHIIVALLLGILFYDFGNDAQKVLSNTAALFFDIFFLYLANSLSTVQIFPMEMAILLREHLNNWYQLKSYYSVKILTDFVMQLLCTTSFLLISYYMTGQPMEFNRLFQVWSICVLISCIGQTFGMLTSTTFNSQLGTFIIPVVSIPLVLFSGFFIKLKEVPAYLQFMTHLSLFRYAFEGILQALYVDRSNLTCREIYCYFRSPKTVLKTMDMPSVSFNVIIIALSIWVVCLHVCTYLILSWKVYYAKR